MHNHAWSDQRPRTFVTMDWITIIWVSLMGGCLTVAFSHLFIWVWQRRAADFYFAVATLAVIGIAIAELAIMRATSVDQIARAQQLAHVPVFVLVVALVVFVRLYFGTGRWWLGLTAIGVRFVTLLINFIFPPNLNFREITGIQHLHFLGQTVSAPVGIANPWTRLGELSSLLVLIFVIDASVSLWRKGKPENRRRAAIVGGSIIFFILLAAGISALINLQVIRAPYLISFPFVAIIAAMAVELGSDRLRAGDVARRLRTSEALRGESENRFQVMADAAPVLIWMSGTDKLCTFFNKGWLDFTGRTMEQELGNGWAEGVHPGDFERCLKIYATAFDLRKPFTMEYRLRRYDGEYRWITDNGVPRHDPRGNFDGYIGACVDITELLSKEQALHEVEERIALSAEAAHLGVWELDTTTNEIWMSDKTRTLLQFEPDSRIDHVAWQERVHPEDRAARDAALRKAIETGGGYEIEYRMVLPDGTVRWVGGRGRCITDAHGGPTRLLGVSMDVSERKQAEELFRLTTEASPSGTVLIDGQGHIMLVNAHIEKLFGYDRDELIGRPVEVLVPERLAMKHPSHRAKFLEAPEVRPMGAGRELFARRKDDSEFPVEIGLNPIQTPQGILVLATVTDISARKVAEEEMQRRREQINLLSRVSLLGEMAASIAHEVNQPLAGIISNASAGQRFIDRGDADLAKLREILVDVVEDGRRAHEVIRNIRTTIKTGVGLRQTINLNDVVLNVTNLMQPDATVRSCELQTSLAKDLPSIEGDPVQIQQVLINLVGNAFDAMRKTTPNQRKVEVATEKNGEGTIRVTVRDHGSGIPSEVQARLFEQFFTTKDDGLGMGLAIVHSIIEAHEGTIVGENVEGGGARFAFTLPVME